MGYKTDKMASMTSGFEGRSYDSDEDLSEEEQKKIREANNPSTAEIRREDAWEKAGTYPKIKKFFKSQLFGDKRKIDE